MREDIPGALSNAKNIADLEKFDWPDPDDFDYSNLKSDCSKYDEYALLYGSADIWQRPCLVRGMENALMDFYIKDYTNAFNHSGGRIDIFLVISDLGS